MFNGTTQEDLNKVGVKFDKDKRQWWFVWQFLPELEQVVDILDYGNKKYPAESGSNWVFVEQPQRRYSSALMRHLSAYLQGEKNDPETGKSHLAHAMTNLLFLMWFDRNEMRADKAFDRNEVSTKIIEQKLSDQLKDFS